MNVDQVARDISPGAVEYANAQVDNCMNFSRTHFAVDPAAVRNYLELALTRAWLSGARTGLEAAREVFK